jgi:hypothetical protein
MRFAGERERPRPGARCDQEVAGLYRLVSCCQTAWTQKPCLGLKRDDAGFLKRSQAGGRNRVGKAALEAHQGGPVKGRRPAYPESPHSAVTCRKIGRTDEHLLRIAPAKRAGPAEGKVIHDRDAPPPLAGSGMLLREPPAPEPITTRSTRWI